MLERLNDEATLTPLESERGSGSEFRDFIMHGSLLQQPLCSTLVSLPTMLEQRVQTIAIPHHHKTEPWCKLGEICATCIDENMPVMGIALRMLLEEASWLSLEQVMKLQALLILRKDFAAQTQAGKQALSSLRCTLATPQLAPKACEHKYQRHDCRSGDLDTCHSVRKLLTAGRRGRQWLAVALRPCKEEWQETGWEQPIRR